MYDMTQDMLMLAGKSVKMRFKQSVIALIIKNEPDITIGELADKLMLDNTEVRTKYVRSLLRSGHVESSGSKRVTMTHRRVDIDTVYDHDYDVHTYRVTDKFLKLLEP